MNAKEIIKGNKLIAEFMGLKPFNTGDKWALGHNSCHCCEITEEKTMNGFASIAKYHSSWDWLMPVVEKIESMFYFFNSAPFIDDEMDELSGEYFCVVIQRRTTNLNLPYFIDITGCSSKKEATWKAVVEFIKWYNEKKLTER